jgi:hypothetical protein
MFESKKELLYLSMEQKQSQQGKMYTLIILFNPESYDKYIMYADPNIKISAGQNSMVTVTLTGYLNRGFLNFMVSKIEPFPKA